MNKENLSAAVLGGKFAALTTTTAVMALAASEKRNPVAAINSVSHIPWGDEAFEQEEASVKYTGSGLVLNAAACISWAVALELLLGGFARRSPAAALGSGTAVSLLAYVTDYHIVPPRLTPGFEQRLSSRSLLVVYLVLALSLAAVPLAQASRRH